MNHTPAYTFPSHPIIPHPTYRPDIDGLRALAVLSVVIFHAYPKWFKGGFIGVDIFFVISGFLITAILLAGLEKHQFNLMDFYDRRIRRIFPVLLTVMASCYIAGWLLLLSDEYKQLGKHIVGGSLFLSNFMLWRESGYFEEAAENKPLLHLWSLGIEEQFYIAWPVILYLGWRLRLNLLKLTLGLAIASFIFNLFISQYDLSMAFYAPLTRAWELLIGAILACLTQFKPQWLPSTRSAYWQNLASITGLTLIGLGFFLINGHTDFPGPWPLFPTLGCALLIAAGGQSWINRVFLSHRWVVWFGLISFPLYLWHWPMLAFIHILGEEISPFETLQLIALCVFLSWVSVQLIEKPLRHGHTTYTKAWVLLGLMLLLGLAGYVCYQQKGWDGYGYREPGKHSFAAYFENDSPQWQYFTATDMLNHYRNECNFYNLDQRRQGHTNRAPLNHIAPACYVRDKQHPRAVLIWGDSHAQQLYSGLRENMPKRWQILQVASSGCAPALVGSDSSRDHCARSNWFAIETIRQTQPDVVVMAQTAKHDGATLYRMAQILQGYGVKKVIIVGPTPHWRMDLPNLVMRKLWVNTPERTWMGVDINVHQTNLTLKHYFGNGEDIAFADALPVFCNADGCLTRIGEDRQTGITTWDYGHLTPVASDYLARHLLVELITRRVETDHRLLHQR